VRGLLEVSGEPPGAAPDLSATAAEPHTRPAPAPARRRSRLPVYLALTALLLAGMALTAWAFRGELAHRFARASHNEPSGRGPATLAQTSEANTPDQQHQLATLKGLFVGRPDRRRPVPTRHAAAYQRPRRIGRLRLLPS